MCLGWPRHALGPSTHARHCAYHHQHARPTRGVVISASHNAYQDNGIKIFGSDGFKLPDRAEADIEALMDGDVLDKNRPTGTGVGSAERLEDAQGRYVAFVKQTFPNGLTLEGLKIVVDAANGAAYKVAPAVFRELGAQVFCIGVRPNGKNINRECGAVHPEACARECETASCGLGYCARR